LKFANKILFGGVILLQAFIAKAQNETYLQPFASLLISNSAFAGLNDNTNFNTGNQFYSINEEEAYNLFYATYDTYSDKLNGGIGLTFQSGIIGSRNISTTELGLSYAGFKIKTANGKIISSISVNTLLATKQWFSYILDETFSQTDYIPSPPGKKFTRYYLLKPGAAFLWDTKTATVGLSAKVSKMYSLSDEDEVPYKNEEISPLSLTFYFNKKIKGNRNGLKASPYEAYPELIVFYNQDFISSRASYRIEHIHKSYGVFMQNDFTNSIHCLGGTLGYRNNNLKINLNMGIGIPEVSESMGTTCELSLHIIIPPVYYSKIKPWAPKLK
jgi:hypothetical protein